MDEVLGSVGLGLWFGITGPLLCHVGYILLSGGVGMGLLLSNTFRRMIQYVVTPVVMIGILGIASLVGQSRVQAGLFSPAMLVGFAVYGIAAWMHHRDGNSDRTNA
jgi:Na+/H+-dicarboxylate symporter